MRGDDDFHQQISAGAAIDSGLAFFAYADALTVVDTCGDRNIDCLAAGDIACSAAVGALILDDLAASAAVRTSLNISHCSEEGLLCKYDLALSSALGAHLG